MSDVVDPVAERFEEDFEQFQFMGGGPLYRFWVNRDRKRRGKRPFDFFTGEVR
jgi:hypothetical protein